MKKYTILVVMLFSSLGMLYAQDATTTTTTTSTSSGDFAPAAGDISVAVLFGRGNFLNGINVVSPVNASWTVPGYAPYQNTVDTNENPVTNIVGAEVRYFIADNIAVKLSGGAILRNTPQRVNIPGYIDLDANNATWIPAYAAVEADNRFDANLNLGGEYHFKSKYSRLFPYAGVTIPFYYSRRSVYNPTINDEDATIVDIGFRTAEVAGFGGQLVGGVDYYLMEGLYFGFEIKPVSVVYAFSNNVPAPGLEAGVASNTTFSFFSQTFFKLGFRF